MKITKSLLFTLLLAGTAFASTGCSKNNNTVTIYTSTEDYNIALMKKCLGEQFPNYKIRKFRIQVVCCQFYLPQLQ